MISLDLDPDIQRIAAGLDPMATNVQLALKRAVRKLMLWYRRQVLQYASRLTGIAQKKFGLYNRVHLKMTGTEGYLWVGFSPMPLHEAGRVSWSRSSAGAKVKGRQYAGAFYQSVYGSQPKVWIRSSSNRTEGHPLYHPRRKHRSFSGEVDRGRFPVELLGMEMDEIPAEIARRLNRAAHARFQTLFRHELEFALK
uniref:Prophage minor tail protein Z (GPZ) n=1 Tax=Candidatus Kentrum sp. LFY TaxID=2126342 RepID=A0A450W6Z3_9GAMM|nr:MAG: hypothetical protein BECKLFY1418C_GA0070996_100183 [Candidatus Kentron sp. LFY]